MITKIKRKTKDVLTVVQTIYRIRLECGHLATSIHSRAEDVKKVYTCWSCTNQVTREELGFKCKPNRRINNGPKLHHDN